MRTEIKICGLSSRQAVATCIEANVDLIGFIFFEKSPRHLSLDTAEDLSRFAGKVIGKVAVCVNASPQYLDDIVSHMKPDFLQLHGKETPEQVSLVKKRYGLPVIKAFAIRTQEDFHQLAAYEGIADRFLLDAKAPQGSDLPGGNGVSFDWNLLTSFKTTTRIMLSGGLDQNNIQNALKISGAHSIDVSSGVENAPGIKDIAKIASFIKTVREHDLASCFDKPE
jgi:phosphoribosylanthranilate isomerase